LDDYFLHKAAVSSPHLDRREVKCMAEITASGGVGGLGIRVVLSISLDPEGQIALLSKSQRFLKTMEMVAQVHGEGNSSGKTISEGRDAKTGWSAVCPMRDRERLKAGPKTQCCLSVAEVLWNKSKKACKQLPF